MPCHHSFALFSKPQVKVLVEQGKARLDVKSRNGNTPLDSAHLASATAVVTFLESRVRLSLLEGWGHRHRVDPWHMMLLGGFGKGDMIFSSASPHHTAPSTLWVYTGTAWTTTSSGLNAKVHNAELCFYHTKVRSISSPWNLKHCSCCRKSLLLPPPLLYRCRPKRRLQHASASQHAAQTPCYTLAQWAMCQQCRRCWIWAARMTPVTMTSARGSCWLLQTGTALL